MSFERDLLILAVALSYSEISSIPFRSGSIEILMEKRQKM
ncbi:hypothetical protein wVul_1549 [Wolbachia endosymbiont of Armadillidium vulgare str. wVulC]|nr:hypothetical protein wVul_1549 [Wolbachia endosymbiont of Armadillidium vulgare str. wVulC]